MKRPSFQFYPADWRKDNELQSCSIGARGLWIEMICIAHECEPYGYLMVNGRPMTDLQIARLIGVSSREFASNLQQLETAGVVSRGENGALFSRRMVRDEQIRMARAAGGPAGAEHGRKGAKHGSKGGRPRADKGSKKPPLPDPFDPPPSSSSSSSSSTSMEEDALRASKANPTFAIPDWMPKEAWEGFVEMRKKIRKPLTHQAIVLAVGKLAKMRGQGEDVQAVLEQAILGSYQGLFPVKQDQKHGAAGSQAGRGPANKSFGATVAEVVDRRARERGGLFDRPGPEIVVPAGGSDSPGDPDDDGKPRLALVASGLR